MKMQIKQEVDRNDREVGKANSSTRKKKVFCKRMNVRVPLD